MTWYDRIKLKLTEDGYIIYRETYRCGTRVYSIRTPKINGQCTVYCDVAYDIARMLCKELNLEIIDAPSVCVALNYKPEPVEKGNIRYTAYQNDPENRLIASRV